MHEKKMSNNDEGFEDFDTRVFENSGTNLAEYLQAKRNKKIHKRLFKRPENQDNVQNVPIKYIRNQKKLPENTQRPNLLSCSSPSFSNGTFVGFCPGNTSTPFPTKQLCTYPHKIVSVPDRLKKINTQIIGDNSRNGKSSVASAAEPGIANQKNLSDKTKSHTGNKKSDHADCGPWRFVRQSSTRSTGERVVKERQSQKMDKSAFPIDPDTSSGSDDDTFVPKKIVKQPQKAKTSSLKRTPLTENLSRTNSMIMLATETSVNHAMRPSKSTHANEIPEFNRPSCSIDAESNIFKASSSPVAKTINQKKRKVDSPVQQILQMEKKVRSSLSEVECTSKRKLIFDNSCTNKAETTQNIELNFPEEPELQQSENHIRDVIEENLSVEEPGPRRSVREKYTPKPFWLGSQYVHKMLKVYSYDERLPLRKRYISVDPNEIPDFRGDFTILVDERNRRKKINLISGPKKRSKPKK
ncbi:uncharacterized protein LOC132265041 [Phlebotomus argentipes]|uniref:uncharacterized protein LOC132265041 n=1 Tax=Phlebotomus argentipes TaxID=94469 RepID=UPI002892C211|nr:uncharacterized protein LOC132265041 [Phlebotomus argentipes]